MRTMIAGAFVSLDGVMQAPGGPPEDPTGGFEYGGWTVPYWDEPMGQFMDECFSRPFDLVLGRKTYDIFAAHWPFVGEDDPIGKTFTAATKYVAVADMPILAGAGVQLVGENRAQDLKEKWAAHGELFEWHFIGQLQSRKVRSILPHVSMIHSVASDSALRELDR